MNLQLKVTDERDTVIYKGSFESLEGLEEEGLRKASHAIGVISNADIEANENASHVEDTSPQCRQCGVALLGHGTCGDCSGEIRG